MAIKFEYNAENNQLVIHGKLTIHHASQVLKQLRGKKNLALDLSDVSDMDGSGLQLLVAAKRDLGIRLMSANDTVSNVFKLVGLSGMLEVES